MNVGGHRLTNDDLRDHCEQLGFEVLFLYRASGNVVIRSELAAETVESEIEAGLGRLLGYAVPTIVRDTTALQQLIDDQPFERGKPQVVFRKSHDSVDPAQLGTPIDDFVAHQRDLYWLPHEGISGTEVDAKSFDTFLGVNTVRTVGTVEGIVKKVATFA